MSALRVCAVTVVLLGTACSGSSPKAPSTPTTPTTPTTPQPPTTPTNTWSAAGQIVANGTPQGIGGATLTPGWSLAAVTADTQGNYTLGDVANPPTTPYPVSVSASGFLTHDVWITWARGPRTGVNLDLIRSAAPFSMDFYRQLVRDGLDKSDGYPWRNLRWTQAPSFYVQTVDQNGRAIEPEVLALTIDTLRRAVPLFTANTFSAAVIETGAASREAPAGWINVLFRRDPNSNRCGQSYVGRNPGEITLWDDLCACGSVKIPGDVTLHEAGHAMGFFHVSDPNSVMYGGAEEPGCRTGVLSAAESYHVAIAYSRPRGNTDPDRDPSSAGTFAARDPGGPLVR